MSERERQIIPIEREVMKIVEFPHYMNVELMRDGMRVYRHIAKRILPVQSGGLPV